MAVLTVHAGAEGFTAEEHGEERPPLALSTVQQVAGKDRKHCAWGVSETFIKDQC